jgi:hypothetical protein
VRDATSTSILTPTITQSPSLNAHPTVSFLSTLVLTPFVPPHTAAAIVTYSPLTSENGNGVIASETLNSIVNSESANEVNFYSSEVEQLH